MNIKKFQTTHELKVFNWDNMDLGERMWEILNSSKQHENDLVEIQQVINIGRVSDIENSHRIIVILNHTRDLDNPGEKVIL